MVADGPSAVCNPGPIALTIEPLDWPENADAVVAFLSAHEWPYHGVPNLTPDDAAAVRVAGGAIASFWIRDDDEVIGLVRLLDLDDVDDGSPRFDLRIATMHRGRGVGRFAVQWLTDHLFRIYDSVHRIEATTRSDNMAMQAVFARSGYRQEGRFVEAWKSADGTWLDTLVYAILRHEFVSAQA
ncbi:MAG: hypothetical protein JWL72_407 [Ilumatobacteraceae bacterium]|nr:hypothetical protein [Ilumatobacteraceae bacterium]